MLGHSKLTAFLATTNPRRARTFYQKTLGLRLVSEDAFALEFHGAGAPLRIQKVERFTPHPFTAIGWRVANIRRAVRALTKRRVVFERYAFMPQDDDAIWTAPSGTRVAWFKDPDGQLLSISQGPS
jgi:catechol 2,3-dioxygenase-like lactoylglutathione lyase family enzyme